VAFVAAVHHRDLRRLRRRSTGGGIGIRKVSDVIGRKPLLVAAIVAIIVGLVVFLLANGMAPCCWSHGCSTAQP
jgi:hypothetical protein